MTSMPSMSGLVFTALANINSMLQSNLAASERMRIGRGTFLLQIQYRRRRC